MNPRADNVGGVFAMPDVPTGAVLAWPGQQSVLKDTEEREREREREEVELPKVFVLG
jgi:hypothetical protein